MSNELLMQNLVFWPGLVLAIHFFYVKKFCHSDWSPWWATARFIWAMFWPTVAAFVIAISAINGLGLSGILANVIIIGALFPLIPSYSRATKLIENPSRSK